MNDLQQVFCVRWEVDKFIKGFPGVQFLMVLAKSRAVESQVVVRRFLIAAPAARSFP